MSRLTEKHVGELEIKNSYGTVIYHEASDGNRLIVRAEDRTDAEFCGQEFLNSLPDNDEYEYEVKSCYEDDEQDGIFYLRYNCFSR